MHNKVTVLNLQKNVEIDTRSLLAFAKKLPGKATGAKTDTFSVAFVTDDSMWRTNWAFRGKDSTTDVLSFPHVPDDFDPDKNNLGDIVISADQAAKQAGENGVTLENEIRQLILHGVLHLCGYDHETDSGEMDARELELRKKLGI